MLFFCLFAGLRIAKLVQEIYFNSGRPATLVSRDNSPAKAAAETTATQLTSPSTAAVPIVATAVCATVLTARTPAAYNQFIIFSHISNSS